MRIFAGIKRFFMLDLVKDFRFREKVHMRWSDLDEMRHVNNAVYLTYFEQGRINYFSQAIHWDWRQTGLIQARAEIDYLIPLFLTDNPFLYIRTVKVGNKSLTMEHLIVDEQSHQANGKDRLIARGTVVLVAYDYHTQASTAVPEAERNKIMTYEKGLLVQ
jgi:acyl-CoA thioester hydrolase